MPRPLTIEELTRIVVDARRRQLRAWIEKQFDGQQARFVEATGINQGELSGLLKKKSFGEKRARSLELLAGMPYLYLDQVLPGPGTDRPKLTEPDAVEKIAALARRMSPIGQYVALGRMQELAEQYPDCDGESDT